MTKLYAATPASGHDPGTPVEIPEADVPAEQPAAAEKAPRDPRGLWVRVVAAAVVVADAAAVAVSAATCVPRSCHCSPNDPCTATR